MASALKVLILLATVLMPGLIKQTVSLANCPNGCTCDDESLDVSCLETNLDVMPIALNPSIRQLIMKKNKIKSIESAIQFYPDLEFLDLSGNHLLKLPSKTFQYQKKLKEMRLNSNKIGQIDSETFHGMESLQILNLRGNLIDQLDDNSFSSLLNLEELNLGENRIAEIKPDAFYRLHNLKILYLDDNSLNHVPAEAFLPLLSLAELFIGFNSFSILDKNSFEKLKKMTTLSLKGAQLNNISVGAFAGLSNLRVLDLSDNKLARIPTKELSALHRLEELLIGMNDFEIIPEKAFEGLSNLQILEIVGANKLVRVQNNAFIENGNLRTIRFKSNEELSQFESHAFHGLPYLKELILKKNAIESIRENLYEWENLELLDLSDNPLRCDCHLLWYKTFLNIRSNKNENNNNATNPDGSSAMSHQHNICASPAYAKGKDFSKLSSELFGCTPNSDPKIQTIICGLLVITAGIITALILIAYKCRRRKFRNVLKDSGWDISSTIGRKVDRDYHKTYAAPQYIDTMRKSTVSSDVQHCNMPNNYQQPMIPITEL